MEQMASFLSANLHYGFLYQRIVLEFRSSEGDKFLHAKFFKYLGKRTGKSRQGVKQMGQAHQVAQ